MDAPATFPTWATSADTDGLSGQSNKLAPPVAKRAIGWAYREKPPRNWLNWWMNLVGQWINWSVYGTHTKHVSALSARQTDATKWSDSSPTGYIYQAAVDGQNAFAYVSLPLEPTHRLLSWKVYCWTDGAESGVHCQLKIFDGSDGTERNEAVQDDAATDAFKTVGQTGLTLTVGADEFFAIEINTNKANARIYGIEYTYDGGQ